MLQLPNTERSFWREAYHVSQFPELTEDLSVDVAIVGGGITGLTAAYFLKKSGLSVAVIEKRTIGAGTTGRTTGKITSQHSLIYSELAKRLGKKSARAYGMANQAALKQIERIIMREKIDCDWRREDNYVYTADEKNAEKFKQEAELAAELGLPATLEKSAPLPFQIQAAVKFADQATFHSQKYLGGLAHSVNGAGSYVFEFSDVIGIKDGSPGRVKTKQATVRAKHIIVATNVPTLPLEARGGYCVLEYPTESYIVAGRFEGELRGMYISPDKKHYSILPVEHDGQRLLLIGGAGHISGLRVSKKLRYRQLVKYAEKQFNISSIEYHWSDRDYLSYDGPALVGKLYPWSKNLYVATAFRKWGLSGGTVAAMILHDAIVKRPNPWAYVFNSIRTRPIKSIPRVILSYAKHPLSS